MKNYKSLYKIESCSPNSLLIHWNLKNLEPEFVKYQQALIKEIKDKSTDLKYLTPSFDAILIRYTNTIKEINYRVDEINKLLNSFSESNVDVNNTNRYEIPVCYEDFGIDLEIISKHSGLSISEIIQIHSEQIYTLYFIGFLPGFLYLAHVDKRIQIPRKQNPRSKVEQGSVGIAEYQTGIYPSASPGGWQIVGRTPIELFNVDKHPPSPFKPGDQIKFKAISKKEFNNLQKSKNQFIKSA